MFSKQDLPVCCAVNGAGFLQGMGLGRLLLAGVTEADVPSTLSRLRKVSRRTHGLFSWLDQTTKRPFVRSSHIACDEPLRFLLALALGTLAGSALLRLSWCLWVCGQK